MNVRMCAFPQSRIPSGRRDLFRQAAFAFTHGAGWQDRRIIQFIAATPGEGTSTVAREFAHTASQEFGRKVLLLGVGVAAEEKDEPWEGAAPGYFGTARAPETGVVVPTAGIAELARGLALAKLDDFGGAGELALADAYWEQLKSYDDVVIDAPSAAASPLGVLLAPRADQVILVVEAERTRRAVVLSLQKKLEAGGAKVAGVVLNKRRRHLPRWLYERL